MFVEQFDRTYLLLNLLLVRTSTGTEKLSPELQAEKTAEVVATEVIPPEEFKETVPSEPETQKDIPNEAEPLNKESTEEQQDQTTTQQVAEKGEESMKESVEQRPQGTKEPEESVATEILQAEEAQVEKPQSDEPLAEKPCAEEQLVAGAKTEHSDKDLPESRLPEEEKAPEEKQTDTPVSAADSTRHDELTPETAGGTAEPPEHGEHESVNKTDATASPEPAPGVENDESDAKSRGSPKSDHPSNSPDIEKLGKVDVLVMS